MKQSALTEIARTEQRTKHIKIESAPQVNTSRIESASTEHPASVASALSTLRAGLRVRQGDCDGRYRSAKSTKQLLPPLSPQIKICGDPKEVEMTDGTCEETARTQREYRRSAPSGLCLHRKHPKNQAAYHAG